MSESEHMPVVARVHDPLCLSVKHPGPHGMCDCGTIRLVRADERERIVQFLWPHIEPITTWIARSGDPR